MSEDQEKDQLGLWEKLNRLYGDKERPAGVESLMPGGDEAEPEELPEDSAPGSTQEVAGMPPSEGIAGAPVEAVIDSQPPKSKPGAVTSPANGLGRIYETCGRCRRSCKQTGRKLNRMLCIGFLPIDE